MMTPLHDTRAVLGAAAGIAAAERAPAVEPAHVLTAIAHASDDGARALVERFPSLAAAAPRTPPRGLWTRLTARRKPSPPVRAAAERAFAAAARAGVAPSPLDLVEALAQDPANRTAFSALDVPAGEVLEWLDERRRPA